MFLKPEKTKTNARFALWNYPKRKKLKANQILSLLFQDEFHRIETQ